jgi:hypothetical protein
MIEKSNKNILLVVALVEFCQKLAFLVLFIFIMGITIKISDIFFIKLVCVYHKRPNCALVQSN